MWMKRVQKTVGIIGLVMGFVMSAQVMAADSKVKVGVIDMQKAIQETSAGKKAKKELEAQFNKKKKELEKKETDLKKMNEDLEKKALVLSDDVKAKKASELQQEMLKYREMVGKSQMEIQKQERELTMPILKKLQDIIEEVARKEDYTVILEKSEQGVLWAEKEVDLTERVVKEFEKRK